MSDKEEEPVGEEEKEQEKDPEPDTAEMGEDVEDADKGADKEDDDGDADGVNKKDVFGDDSDEEDEKPRKQSRLRQRDSDDSDEDAKKAESDKDSDDDADALDSSSKEEFGEHRMLDVASRISKYSWDQTNSQVSLYISFDGAKALREECIECHFRPRGVLLIISHGGKQHWFKIPNLCHAVDTAACKQTVKTDTIALKLRKAEQGLQWSDLTDEKDQYKQKRAFRIEKGDLKDATTEQLIADMYQNANDDEREGLREAMRINREKRGEDARSATASNSK